MKYVQYYDYDTSGTLSEVLGDRGLVILDSRNSLRTMHEDAKEFNGFRRPKFPAYKLMMGKTFSRSRSISDLIIFTIIILLMFCLSGCKTDKTIFIKKDIKNLYINSQLNIESVQNNSGASLRCYCLLCLPPIISISGVKFTKNGELEKIGPFDINFGSDCTLTVDIEYTDGWRKYLVHFKTDENSKQFVTLIIE
jgi:hypothetical protein